MVILSFVVPLWHLAMLNNVTFYLLCRHFVRWIKSNIRLIGLIHTLYTNNVIRLILYFIQTQKCTMVYLCGIPMTMLFAYQHPKMHTQPIKSTENHKHPPRLEAYCLSHIKSTIYFNSYKLSCNIIVLPKKS